MTDDDAWPIICEVFKTIQPNGEWTARLNDVDDGWQLYAPDGELEMRMYVPTPDAGLVLQHGETRTPIHGVADALALATKALADASFPRTNNQE